MTVSSGEAISKEILSSSYLISECSSQQQSATGGLCVRDLHVPNFIYGLVAYLQLLK